MRLSPQELVRTISYRIPLRIPQEGEGVGYAHSIILIRPMLTA
jgi:hypothetical protein